MDYQGINLGYRGFIARRPRRTTSFLILYTRSLSKLIITELKLKAASHSGASADPILFTIYLFHGRSSPKCRHPHYHVSFLALLFSRQSTRKDSFIESSQTQTSDYHPAIRTLIFITIELHFGSVSNTGHIMSPDTRNIRAELQKHLLYTWHPEERQISERSKGARGERRTLA